MYICKVFIKKGSCLCLTGSMTRTGLLLQFPIYRSDFLMILRTVIPLILKNDVILQARIVFRLSVSCAKYDRYIV